MLELEDVLGLLQVLQAVDAAVQQRGARREAAVDQAGGCLRDDGLLAVGQGLEAGGSGTGEGRSSGAAGLDGACVDRDAAGQASADLLPRLGLPGRGGRRARLPGRGGMAKAA